MNGIIIATLAVVYVCVGMLLMRWMIRRGAMTIQNNWFYGIVALIWPLTIVLIIYWLFNALVHSVVEV